MNVTLSLEWSKKLKGGKIMKVQIRPKEDGIIVSPETDFESDFLETFRNRKLTVFIKSGMSADHIVGLAIIKEKE